MEDFKMDEFDGEIFESLIDKIVIGNTDEQGNTNPFLFTFVFKAGIKFSDEFYKKVANQSDIMEIKKLSPNGINEHQFAYTFEENATCGVRGEVGEEIEVIK